MCFTVQLSRFLSFWQLWYFIISFLACQELFSKVFYQPFGCAVLFFDSHTRLSHLHRFVKNFLKLFSSAKADVCWWISMTCSEELFLSLFTATFTGYHILFRLSTTFSETFLFLWQLRCQRRKRDLNPRTARTVYTLSRGASSATWVFLQRLNKYLIQFTRSMWAKLIIPYQTLICQSLFYFFLNFFTVSVKFP